MRDPNRMAAGLMCHAHFERGGRELLQSEVDACPDCQAAKREQAERIQREDTIDPSRPYGTHIALRCKKHPDLRWSTKNISHIGARSIFYFGMEPECKCSIRDLEPVPHSE